MPYHDCYCIQKEASCTMLMRYINVYIYIYKAMPYHDCYCIQKEASCTIPSFPSSRAMRRCQRHIVRHGQCSAVWFESHPTYLVVLHQDDGWRGSETGDRDGDPERKLHGEKTQRLLSHSLHQFQWWVTFIYLSIFVLFGRY